MIVPSIPPPVVPLEDLTLADYERARGINLDGVVYGARALIPRLYRRGGGDILITASVAGLVAMTPDPIYGATKHAVVGFARALGESCAARGVHVCSINPGFADTNILGPDGAQNLRAMGIAVMDPSRSRMP
ncbi:MAG: SDR family oxidoreductase [Ilumatobacteraceae bacterium]